MTADNALQEKVLGRWISHNSGKDTTVINRDSIFSFEWIKSASYSIDSNIISIGDKSYYNTFFLSLSQDTLIFTDQDGNKRKFTWIRD
jgi:hypothetical protein